VLTAEVKRRAQALLEEGESAPEVSRAIGVAGDTLRKASRAGRLHGEKSADGRRRQRQEPAQ
jgi:transposase-like protein